MHRCSWATSAPQTVVALFAMLLALENGYQAALMAPTELLAEQHYRTLGHYSHPSAFARTARRTPQRRDKKAARARRRRAKHPWCGHARAGAGGVGSRVLVWW